jgi:hypothetical protein
VATLEGEVAELEAMAALRAEVNALTKILLDAKIVDEDTLTRIVGEEAEYLSAAYEKKFPGAEPTDDGMTFDLAVWSETMKRLGL